MSTTDLPSSGGAPIVNQAGQPVEVVVTPDGSYVRPIGVATDDTRNNASIEVGSDEKLGAFSGAMSTAHVKPNNYPRPGPSGNCIGCIVPKTSLYLASPNDQPETPEEEWWDKFKQGSEEAAKYYKDNISDSLHEFGSDAAELGGTALTAGRITAGVGGLIVGSGVGVPVGAAVTATGGAISAVGVGVAGAGSIAETGATVLDSAADWIVTGEMPNLVKPALALGQRLLTKWILSKVPGLGGKQGGERNAVGKGGARVEGKRRCILRPYKPDTCKSEGKTGHHVVPDRVFRTGRRGSAHPYGITEDSGLVICVDGSNLSQSKDHGKIHHIYDSLEKVAGFGGRDSSKPNQLPLGTAKLGVLEAAGAMAVGRVTGCNPILLEAQLRAYHLSKGLQIDTIVRADPSGKTPIDFSKILPSATPAVPPTH